MTSHAALFALDSVTLFASLLLAVGIVALRPRSAAMWVAALILVNSAGYVMFSRFMFGSWIPEPFQLELSSAFVTTLRVTMNTTPGLFMLLCFLLFHDGGLRRFPRWLLLLFAVQVALEDLVPSLFGITTRPSLEPVFTDSHAGWRLVLETLPALLQALFIGAAMYWTLAEWRADLVEGRRKLRALLMAVIGISLVSNALLGRLVFPSGPTTLFYMHEAYMAFAVVLYACLIIALLRALPSEAEQVLPANPSAADHAPTDLDYQAFQKAMSERAYSEPGLTVSVLAARLRVPEYRLRRLINRRLGYRNFNHMLHTYRLEDAKLALADPRKRDLPILSIALSLGYQSINPFNRAFRELVGTTPSTFREQALAGSRSAEGASAPTAAQRDAVP